MTIFRINHVGEDLIVFHALREGTIHEVIFDIKNKKVVHAKRATPETDSDVSQEMREMIESAVNVSHDTMQVSTKDYLLKLTPMWQRLGIIEPEQFRRQEALGRLQQASAEGLCLMQFDRYSGTYLFKLATKE